MTNTLPNRVLPAIVFLLAIFTRPSIAFAAARVYFDPTSVTVSQTNEFTVQVKIDAETSQVIGSDAIVSYAGADLDVTSVSTGGYFPEFTYANNASSGRLEIHGYVSSSDQSKTGAGTLASVKFKSNKNSGSSAISFSCAASGNETNILNTTGTNILSCAQVNQVAVSYTGSSTTNTPTPTSVSGGTNTAPYCANLATDITTATGTPQTVSFTCAGVDPGGLILAAGFVFGDGTSQVVEKNVGSPGSISTTHTYTTIGTLGASCRVRDNDGAYSPTVDACKRIITIRPAQAAATGTPRITPTPTTPIISIIDETPEPPAEQDLASPDTQEALVEEETESNRFWWIVGGATSLVLAFILLRRKNKPPLTPPIAPPESWQHPV